MATEHPLVSHWRLSIQASTITANKRKTQFYNKSDRTQMLSSNTPWVNDTPTKDQTLQPQEPSPCIHVENWTNHHSTFCSFLDVKLCRLVTNLHQTVEFAARRMLKKKLQDAVACLPPKAVILKIVHMTGTQNPKCKNVSFTHSRLALWSNAANWRDCGRTGELPSVHQVQTSSVIPTTHRPLNQEHWTH